MPPPPLRSLRALRAPAGGVEGEEAWRWRVEAIFGDPVRPGAIRDALGPRWLGEQGALGAMVDVLAPRPGWPPRQRLEAAPPAALCTALAVEWDLQSRGPDAAGPALAPGGWVIVRSRGEEGEAAPDELSFQHRIARLSEALADLGVAQINPSLPPAVAAERARALERLRRAWGARVVLRLLAPAPGWEPVGVWAALTHELGMRALPDDRLGFVPAGADRPIFDARGWDGGAPARDLRRGERRLDGLVQGIELGFRPAAVPEPEAVLEALEQVAGWLQGQLGGQLLDEEEEPLEPRLLREAVRLVVTGLRAHGLAPGRGPARLLQGRALGAPPALRVAGVGAR